MADQEDRERESRESPLTKFEESRLEEESGREEAAERVQDGTRPGGPTNDEQQIRNVVTSWHHASGDGDLEAVLPLMAEDVVFLTTGRPPMHGREAFAEGFRNVLADGRLESKGEVQEIRVDGDVAYCWTQLTVTTVPHDGSEPQQRTGPTLTIFVRQPDGRWVVSRDANLLPPPA